MERICTCEERVVADRKQSENPIKQQFNLPGQTIERTVDGDFWVDERSWRIGTRIRECSDSKEKSQLVLWFKSLDLNGDLKPYLIDLEGGHTPTGANDISMGMVEIYSFMTLRD